MRKGMAVLAVGVMVLVAACSSDGDGKTATGPTEQVASKKTTTTTEPKDVTNAAALAAKGSDEVDPSPDDPVQPGAVRKTYEVGPIEVKPGQNNISYQGGQVPKPEESGWIVRIAPNLRREDGTVPPVDVIHLHHGVWLNLSRKDATEPGLPERCPGRRRGEDDLQRAGRLRLPRQEDRQLAHQLHAPQPLAQGREDVDHLHIDFIPATRPEAADIKPVTPDLDGRAERQHLPGLRRAQGHRRERAATPTPTTPTTLRRGPPKNRLTVPADGTLIAHRRPPAPGRPADDLRSSGPVPTAARRSPRRTGRPDTAHLFSSVAKYYEPAGAVSWDVSMYVTPPD